MKTTITTYNKPITADDAEPTNSRTLDALRVQVKALPKEAAPCKPDANGEYIIITLKDGGALLYPASMVEVVDEWGYAESRRSIAVYEEQMPKYARLQEAARLLNEKTGTQDFFVGDTYFDFGQGWLWTTVHRRLKDKTFGDAVQYLYPADQEKILYCKDSQLPQVVDQIIASRMK